MRKAVSSPQKLVALAGYTDICGGIVEIVNAVRVASIGNHLSVSTVVSKKTQTLSAQLG